MSEKKHPHDVLTYSPSDGSRLFYRLWKSENEQAVVLRIHGVESHSLWYENSCTFLQKNGISVYAPDRRGSGLNKDNRGDAPAADRLVRDIIDFSQEIRCASAAPLFLLGQSWGAKSALSAALLNPLLYKGIILMTPGLFTKVGLSLFDKIRLLWGLAFCPTLKIRVPIKNASMFTKEKKAFDMIRQDPLRLTEITARFGAVTLRLDKENKKNGNNLNVPGLLLLAGEEQITDNEKTEAWFNSLSIPKKTKKYPGMRHSLELEEGWDSVCKDVLEWIMINLK